MLCSDEQLLSFSQIAETLQEKTGQPYSAVTVWRWARRGLRGITLETIKIGGRFMSSLEAVERFSRRLAAIPVDGECENESHA